MKLIWDPIGERFYETGVNQGVLYPRNALGLYPLGVPWNGLISITESPSGAEPNAIYADNIKYLTLMSAEEFGATIEAYTYPEEFAKCDGSEAIVAGVFAGQQPRQAFGLAYKTLLGNDTESNDFGYKLHLVYGALAAPSEKGYATVNDTPEAITFSWEITTTPVAVTGFKPTATLVIDSTKVSAVTLALLEDMLYGTADADAYLPLPDDIMALFAGDAPSALTVATVPLDEAVAVGVDTDVVLTFNHKIVSESIVITSDAGVIVAGAKSWDATGKIMTFDPTVNLEAATTYLVTISGVVDIYGRALAPTVMTFTTA
jgi:hypothetical protein